MGLQLTVCGFDYIDASVSVPVPTPSVPAVAGQWVGVEPDGMAIGSLPVIIYGSTLTMTTTIGRAFPATTQLSATIEGSRPSHPGGYIGLYTQPIHVEWLDATTGQLLVRIDPAHCPSPVVNDQLFVVVRTVTGGIATTIVSTLIRIEAPYVVPANPA